MIATDYDREGELIGLEALTEVLEVNPAIAGNGDGSPDGDVAQLVASRPRVKRARYSALTKDEIERAFSNLDDLSYDLADAGAARQDIDLIWGATLTRAVSLATRRFGSNFLSVGRVQSPTLGLIVERELERRAHVPEPYWEVFARFQHPDGAFEAHHSTDRFWEKAEADAALAGTKSPGKVKEVSARRSQRKPPAPFNTTAFTTEASNRLGITPKRAMQLAEDLYMDGFISYPRTDNTVYPASLPTRELVASLVRIPEFEAGAFLLEGDLKPTRGKKETTDHPPIYPTQAVHPGALEGPKQRVYELVAAALPGHLRAADGDRVDPRRHRGGIGELLRPRLGGHRPRLRRHLHLRSLRRRGDPQAQRGPGAGARRRALGGGQGDPAAAADQPGQAGRADGGGRPGDQGNPSRHHPEAVRPRLRLQQPARAIGDGIAMYRAFHEYVPRMATPEMTSELEKDMDQIAAGETSKDQVVGVSREMLHSTTAALQDRSEDLAKVIWAGMDEDKFLGPCKVCEEAGRRHEDGSPNRLRIIELKGGKRMYGCEGWNRDAPESPDSCQVSGPLPGRGYELWRLEERCSVCGEMPRLTVKGFRGRPWKLCLNDACPSMEEMRRNRAEREAKKAERERAAEDGAAANGDGASPANGGAAEDGKRPATRRGAQALPGHGAGSQGGLSLQVEVEVQVLASGVHHPRGDRPLGKDHPGRAARRGPGARDAPACASPAGPMSASGSASCSRIRPRDRSADRAAPVRRGPGGAVRTARPAGPRQGRDVVSDRFVDSTVAYQGAARGLGTDVVEP